MMNTPMSRCVAALEGPHDFVDRSVGRKPDVPNFSLLLQLFGRFEAAALPHRPLDRLGGVEAVQPEQIDILELQPRQRLVEVGYELLRVGLGGDLRLDDQVLPRVLRQDHAQLPFTAAVATGGLDVVDAQLQRPRDRRLHVPMAFGIDFVERLVFPAILVAHPPGGEDGHLKFGAAEASVLHIGIGDQGPGMRMSLPTWSPRCMAAWASRTSSRR
jgi:hypothetical protein